VGGRHVAGGADGDLERRIADGEAFFVAAVDTVFGRPVPGGVVLPAQDAGGLVRIGGE
jgi:hypothetical protein